MLKNCAFAVLVTFGLGLSACSGSYKPLYGNDSGVVEKLSHLSVQEQKTRAGQLVRNVILDGAQIDAPTYNLRLVVSESTTEISKFSSSSAARNRITLRAEYELQHVASKEVIASGKTVSHVEFDLLKLPVSDIQAVEHARAQASKLLGQDIKQRLAASLASSTD